MFRLIVLLCFSIAAVVSCSSPGIQESLEQQGSVAPSDPVVGIDFPVDRQVDEWVPKQYVKGSEYLFKNPRSYTDQSRDHVWLVPESDGMSYAVFEMQVGEDLVDHIVVSETSYTDNDIQPYFMLVNYSEGTWEPVDWTRDPRGPHLINLDVADWSDYESPGGLIHLAVIHYVGNVANPEEVQWNSVRYVSITTVKDQAFEYLNRVIEAQAVYKYERWMYVGLWGLFNGDEVPALMDESLKRPHQAHGVSIQVVETGDLVYSAVSVFPRRDGPSGVWIRDSDVSVRLESNEYGYAGAIARQALCDLRRAEESYYLYNGGYAFLPKLSSPDAPQSPYIGFYLGTGFIDGVELIITTANTNGYTARAGVFGEFAYEMHEDGVIVKVE